MALTVRDLVRIPALRTRVVAGAQGMDRLVTWAHVSELPDIGKWLRGGELVMTVGMGFPVDAEAQEQYLRHLERAGAQAVTIAESDYAPPLTDRMLAAADELAFPVLRTDMEASFAEVSRAVAATESSRAGEQFLVTRQVYDTARRIAQGQVEPGRALGLLGAATGAELFVIQPQCALPFFGAGASEPLRKHIVAALRPHLRPDGRLPSTVRPAAWQATAVHALPVPQSPAVLVATGELSAAALSALPHAALVLAAEVDHVLNTWERQQQLGGELLARLLAPCENPQTAERQLTEWGLTTGARTVAACRTPSQGAGPDERELGQRLALHRVPHAVLRHDHELLLVLLPDIPDALAALHEQLPAPGRIGLSAPLGPLDRFVDAAREARFALEEATEAGETMARYGDRPAGMLPLHGVEDAERLAQTLLGPLRAYDAEHGSDMLVTLAAFLAHNRSWQKTAAELHVHKQTLVYRIRRTEELSGHRLDRTADVAGLWFALQAARRLGWLPPDSGA
jgi:purine catabolism regulator